MRRCDEAFSDSCAAYFISANRRNKGGKRHYVRTKPMSFSLDTLNEEQLKPVMQTEGAVLVTAGAGSGKTRLLTHRIAHIIEDLGVPPYNVLAITFTNKAANEMRERLDKMLEGDATDIWVFTFHALCVRILRKYIKNLGGYSSSFSIYGEQEK